MSRDILGAIGWLLLVFLAAGVGSRFLPDDWYRGINKPAWNPPNRLFAPVWTVLYLLMAISAWLVWRQFGFQAASLPLTLFTLQLVLNSAWTWLFFGRHRSDLALLEILVMWVVLFGTIVSFWSRLPAAGAILLPNLLWVSFAAYLNFTIWKMNQTAA